MGLAAVIIIGIFDLLGLIIGAKGTYDFFYSRPASQVSGMWFVHECFLHCLGLIGMVYNFMGDEEEWQRMLTQQLVTTFSILISGHSFVVLEYFLVYNPRPAIIVTLSVVYIILLIVSLFRGDELFTPFSKFIFFMNICLHLYISHAGKNWWGFYGAVLLLPIMHFAETQYTIRPLVRLLYRSFMVVLLCIVSGIFYRGCQEMSVSQLQGHRSKKF